MQVIKKGFMPDETYIALKDYSDIADIPTNSTIYFITKAKRTANGFYKGQTILGELDFESTEEAMKAFTELKKGRANLRWYKEKVDDIDLKELI